MRFKQLLQSDRRLISGIVKRVKGKERGKLHEAIWSLLEDQDARAVCNRHGILPFWTDEQDQELIRRLFEIRPMSRGWYRPVTATACTGKKIYAERIVLAACLLIGYECKAGSNDPSSPPQVRSAAPSTVALPLKRPTALVLVIRASKLGELPTIPGQLDVQQAIGLISDAVYFRCTSPAEADAKETELGVMAPPETASSQQRGHDVYLRLEIEDGDGLTQATSCFALKKRLRDHPPGIIRLIRRGQLQCPSEALREFHSI